MSREANMKRKQFSEATGKRGTLRQPELVVHTQNVQLLGVMSLVRDHIM